LHPALERPIAPGGRAARSSARIFATRLAALVALAGVLALPGTTFAQRSSEAPSRLITPPPPPTLVVTDGQFQKALAITSLDVEARIVGHLAETTMTMTFHNASRRVLARSAPRD